MGVIDDIKSVVMGWINSALSKAKSYAYGLYNSGWDYASQISKDLWKETNLIWDKIDDIPILTKTTIEDWVDPLIEKAKEYAKDLVNTVKTVIEDKIDSIQSSITSLIEDVEDITTNIGDIQSWITNAGNWFDTRIDSAKDKIIGWVVEKFEYVLDKVFAEEEGKE